MTDYQGSRQDQRQTLWRFAVDRGGTFTDVVGQAPDGTIHTLKLLSYSPNYRDAAIEGIRRILGLASDAPLPAEIIAGIRFGTTVATNALLERRGEKVALLITAGFSDLLAIGNQTRPDIFSLAIHKPERLYDQVIEVRGRLNAAGEEVAPLDTEQLKADAAALKSQGVETVAVVLMHAWRNPNHELTCERILQEAGIPRVFLSHRTMNLLKIVPRGNSTVTDAYLSPVLARYIESVRQETGTIPIAFAQSSGGLSLPEDFTGRQAILSGPAGGVMAVTALARQYGLKGVIGFDMGGTSTDVCRVDNGMPQRIYETTLDGIELHTEMLNIVTVASGGGSRLWFDGQRMRVGPQSAGAEPGPACYGFGGPLTVTDANLMLGRLVTTFFPKTFGPNRDAPLNADITRQQFQDLTNRINAEIGQYLTPEQTALRFLQVANEKMALAIKEISIAKGFDVREDTLVCFGGAGGQHVCALARLLGIRQIMVHPLSGLLSAYGIGLSRPTRQAVASILKPYDQSTHQELTTRFAQLVNQCLPDAYPAEVTIRQWLELRPQGADYVVSVDYRDFETTSRQYCQEFQRLFGFQPDTANVEVANIRVMVEENTEFVCMQAAAPEPAQASHTPKPVCVQTAIFESGSQASPVYLLSDLVAGFVIHGPALLVDKDATILVEPGFTARSDAQGCLILNPAEMTTFSNKQQKVEADSQTDPMLLEVFHNAFMGIAMNMGYTLQNTAHSVNIKERLDFSCALFDAGGNLIANAPHQPVHLGSMSDTVKAVLADYGDNLCPGDVIVTNNPYRGGSHLPDVTVISPVFGEPDGKLLFFTAARGHHADIGGIVPGSMPPHARHLKEEGVLLDNMLLVRDGVFYHDKLMAVLTAPPYPVRNPLENLSNLQAQIAACQKGIQELLALVDRYGTNTVIRYMTAIRQNAAYCVRKALHRLLGDKAHWMSSFADAMDDGSVIQVKITLDRGDNPPESVSCILDFTGSAPEHHHDNLNAPLPVTRSAVLYVLRAISGMEMPLNSGCLDPVTLIVPERTLLNPAFPAPVASGNVETSQRVVDVLLGAFQVAAASQGTMNNLLFEVDGEKPYYETIAGGSGAVEGCHGADGVQVHMTNTRITDPEVLELRHPGVRLQRFTLRKGSGGAGCWHGGNGVIRQLMFLKPATVTLLTERRIRPPFGLLGGHHGQPGKNYYISAQGQIQPLSHRATLQLAAKDVLCIETPGGGGYGKPCL